MNSVSAIEPTVGLSYQEAVSVVSALSGLFPLRDIQNVDVGVVVASCLLARATALLEQIQITVDDQRFDSVELLGRSVFDHAVQGLYVLLVQNGHETWSRADYAEMSKLAKHPKHKQAIGAFERLPGWSDEPVSKKDRCTVLFYWEAVEKLRPELAGLYVDWYSPLSRTGAHVNDRSIARHFNNGTVVLRADKAGVPWEAVFVVASVITGILGVAVSERAGLEFPGLAAFLQMDSGE
jgi:hypothetical protein